MRVTVEAGAADEVQLLSDALDAWQHLSCSELCFSTPEFVEGPPPEGGAPGLHVVESSDSLDLPILSEVTFESSGKIRGARLVLGPTPETARTTADYVAAVGKVVGLQQPVDPVESVLLDPKRFTKPTAADELSYCFLYAPEPVCD